MTLLDEYRTLRGAAALVDRSARGRLIVTGADRRAYLQGLLSNDIAALTEGGGCYAAYLTAQGRMIADVRVFETGESLLVDLDRSVVQTVADRWSQFVFSEDVQISNASESTAQIGVYGPTAAHVVHTALAGPGNEAPSERALNALPVYANAHWLVQGVTVHALRSDDVGVLGFDLLVPATGREEIARLLAASGAREVSVQAAEVTRVEGARPLFHVDMDEDTIPLEAGLEDRAISQTKGCYVGQEIIIRVLHRGHGRVARKLVGIGFGPDDPVPARGESITAASRAVGSITSAVQSVGLGHPIALGYVHRDFSAPGTSLEIGAARGLVSALPFVPIEAPRVQVPG
jgi:folate-binding protein YgfZ